MKKFFLSFLFFLGAFQFNLGFANPQFVGPIITAYGIIENQTIFVWDRDLSFTSYGQDIYAYAKIIFQGKQGPFFIQLPEGDSGFFYLSYVYQDEKGQTQTIPQCKFNVASDHLGNVSVTEIAVPNAYISCTLAGSSNNLVMHLTPNANYRDTIK